VARAAQARGQGERLPTQHNTTQHNTTRTDHARAAAAQIFTRSNFQNGFFDTFVAKSETVLELLGKAAGGAGGEAGGTGTGAGAVVDAQKLFFDFTLDSIAQIAFGVETRCLDPSSERLPFALCFDRCQQLLMKRMIDPVSFLNPLSASEREIRRCTKVGGNGNGALVQSGVWCLVSGVWKKKATPAHAAPISRCPRYRRSHHTHSAHALLPVSH
jgi:hypothetical protein